MDNNYGSNNENMNMDNMKMTIRMSLKNLKLMRSR